MDLAQERERACSVQVTDPGSRHGIVHVVRKARFGYGRRMVTKVKALQILAELKTRVATLQDRDLASPEFKQWRYDVEFAIKNLFDPTAGRFTEIAFGTNAYRAAKKPKADRQMFLHGLVVAEKLLESLIREVENYWSETEQLASPKTKVNPDSKAVFVVHGRNEQLRKSMFDFLRAIGLKPLEWSQAVGATGEASPYIGQVLDTAFSMAQAVVVLMTPDDEAYLKKEFQAEHDADYEKRPTGQARPNVLFEAGMAMGRDPSRDPKRTVLVEIGKLRPFSDVVGRHVLRLNNSSELRQDLAERLRTAECAVDLGGRDWHKVGNFDVARSATDLPNQPSGVSWGSQPRIKGRMER
jgi:predicted nucleotide-binding protein